MANKIFLAFAAIIVCGLSLFVPQSHSLRSGAPSLACSSLTPFHGFNRAKPASASPFSINQSSYEYGPESNITVTISSPSSNSRLFRGFIVQAYDPQTNSRIGHFLPTTDSKPINSCSSATHKNNEEKRSVQLIWVPQAGAQHHHSTRPLFNLGFGTRITAHETATEYLPGHRVDSISGNDRKKVRFHGSIVVRFDDFYTGFESTHVDPSKANDESSLQLGPTDHYPLPGMPMDVKREGPSAVEPTPQLTNNDISLQPQQPVPIVQSQPPAVTQPQSSHNPAIAAPSSPLAEQPKTNNDLGLEAVKQPESSAPAYSAANSQSISAPIPSIQPVAGPMNQQDGGGVSSSDVDIGAASAPAVAPPS